MKTTELKSTKGLVAGDVVHVLVTGAIFFLSILLLKATGFGGPRLAFLWYSLAAYIRARINLGLIGVFEGEQAKRIAVFILAVATLLV
jgi:hypothetical protein